MDETTLVSALALNEELDKAGEGGKLAGLLANEPHPGLLAQTQLTMAAFAVGHKAGALSLATVVTNALAVGFLLGRGDGGDNDDPNGEGPLGPPPFDVR